MNWHYIITVYLKELKDSLRDRRTLISMIVIPTLVIPLIFFVFVTVAVKMVRKATDEATSVVLVGGADSPGVIASFKADPKFQIVESATDYRTLISEKRIRVAVEIPTGFEASLAGGESKTVMIYHFDKDMKSGMGGGEVERFFRTLREKTVENRLIAKGLSPDVIKPFGVKWQNVAPPERVGGNTFGGMVPYIIIILCFTGAMYPAIDLTAGEKERGTMETLLCSPVHRVNIVLGKFLMVMTASIATIVLSLVSATVTIMLGGPLLTSKVKAASAQSAAAAVLPTIDPAGILGVFAMIAPVAVVFAALLLTISLAAKSYKEAQSYVSPLVIVVIMPAMMGMLPGVELSAKTALIPILNVCLACKEMLSGVWHWGYLGLIFGSTAAFAAAAIALCVWMFNRESVMFRA